MFFTALLFYAALSAPNADAFAARGMRRSTHGSTLDMADRRPLMGGNWKLNPTSRSEATNLVTELGKKIVGISGVDVVVFPPHPFLTTVYDKIEATQIKLGGQNCFFEDTGAYTGAVSTCMLKDVGVTYVLAGHSERRTVFKDDDGAIARKTKKILDSGMIPVLCIGETQEEYDNGLCQEVCTIQLLKDLAMVPAEDMAKVVIAYEPVWAIGTGLVCPADTAQKVHAFIRSVIAKKYGQAIADRVIIQYGGSVKPDNVKEIMSKPDIDGCLVGGASLTADSFTAIVGFQK
jgi:triosephosphate isomerase